MDNDTSRPTGSKTLEYADRVEVTVLVDNIIDSLLKSSPGISRFRDRNIEETLLAEHGLSLLVEITHRGEKTSFLLDTGCHRGSHCSQLRENGNQPERAWRDFYQSQSQGPYHGSGDRAGKNRSGPGLYSSLRIPYQMGEIAAEPTGEGPSGRPGRTMASRGGSSSHVTFPLDYRTRSPDN